MGRRIAGSHSAIRAAFAATENRLAKKQTKPAASKSGDICELCAGTGKTVLMHSPRKDRPDFGSLHCAACGGTGRIRKPKPK